MAKNSGIDWTDHTWNPWQGCRKVSPGCAHCYMYREKTRFGQDPGAVVRSKPATFNAPLRWKDPAKVFVCSWSDFFIEEADAWRDEAWDIMRRTPHLTYMLLTKRPENIQARLPPDWPLANVWLGVTAENQEQAEKRIPILLKTPAVLRFVSVEPMVGPVALDDLVITDDRAGEWHFSVLPPLEVSVEDDEDFNGALVDWVICGGESGPEAREMQPEWAMELKRQCAEAGVPFFMKQMSGKASIPAALQGRQFPEQVKQVK